MCRINSIRQGSLPVLTDLIDAHYPWMTVILLLFQPVNGIIMNVVNITALYRRTFNVTESKVSSHILSPLCRIRMLMNHNEVIVGISCPDIVCHQFCIIVCLSVRRPLNWIMLFPKVPRYCQMV